MYGVPKTLNLARFEGRRLTLVGLAEHQVQPEGLISVEGAWELLDSSGRLIDRAVPIAECAKFRLHPLLGQPVTRWQVDPPRSIALAFANGHQLRIFDSSTEHGCFSIQPADIVV